MKITRPVSGKILAHDKGMGTPDSEVVQKRAVELALIDGRSTPTEQDWKRAFLELHGGHHEPNSLGDENEMVGGILETDRVAPSLGRHIRAEVESNESVGEELVAEGVDEAEHEQMLESRRTIDLPEETEE